jgi:hypothetical protein
VADLAALLDIFSEVRTLLARPENDFDWSSWEDETDALAEIDGILTSLRAGDLPDTMNLLILFAPTGPMQEVSLSSGWGNRFLELAERFDDAVSDD